MNKTYIEMCLNGEAEPCNWEKWLDYMKIDPLRRWDCLGITMQEYDDLSNKKRSFDFYVFKSKHQRVLKRLWAGCYVKYVFEIDCHDPHFEFGWVDMVSLDNEYCKIQCDDSFNGGRAVIIRVTDVMEVFPLKERFLVYYKTMICGDCNGCDRMSNELPPDECPYYNFFNACVAKAKGDAQLLSLMFSRPNEENSSDGETGNHAKDEKND